MKDTKTTRVTGDLGIVTGHQPRGMLIQSPSSGRLDRGGRP
ncbi:hypothetical protein ACGFNU_33735 [Spirillospora sp. NPDC048911]